MKRLIGQGSPVPHYPTKRSQKRRTSTGHHANSLTPFRGGYATPLARPRKSQPPPPRHPSFAAPRRAIGFGGSARKQAKARGGFVPKTAIQRLPAFARKDQEKWLADVKRDPERQRDIQRRLKMLQRKPTPAEILGIVRPDVGRRVNRAAARTEQRRQAASNRRTERYLYGNINRPDIEARVRLGHYQTASRANRDINRLLRVGKDTAQPLSKRRAALSTLSGRYDLPMPGEAIQALRKAQIEAGGKRPEGSHYGTFNLGFVNLPTGAAGAALVNELEGTGILGRIGAASAKGWAGAFNAAGIGKTAPGKFALHAIQDAVNLPAQVAPSVYLPVKAGVRALPKGIGIPGLPGTASLTKGDRSELQQMWKGYRDTGVIPPLVTGHLGEAASHFMAHPVYSALELRGLKAGLGRAAGVGMRGAGKRPTLDETALREAAFGKGGPQPGARGSGRDVTAYIKTMEQAASGARRQGIHQAPRGFRERLYAAADTGRPDLRYHGAVAQTGRRYSRDVTGKAFQKGYERFEARRGIDPFQARRGKFAFATGRHPHGLGQGTSALFNARVAAWESMRKEGRAAGLEEVAHILGDEATAKRAPGYLQLAPWIVKRIVRSTKTWKADLDHEIARLEKVRHETGKGGRTGFERRIGEGDEAGKSLHAESKKAVALHEQTLATLKQLRETLTDRDVTQAFTVANHFDEWSRRTRKQLIARGVLLPESAEMAPLMPYAISHMGAKFVGKREGFLSVDGKSELTPDAIRAHMAEHAPEVGDPPTPETVRSTKSKAPEEIQVPPGQVTSPVFTAIKPSHRLASVYEGLSDPKTGARLENVRTATSKVPGETKGEWLEHTDIRADITLDGEKIGSLTRVVRPDGTVVKDRTTIDPQHQRKGIGSRLGQAEEQALAGAGVKRLEVVPTGAAGEALTGRIGGFKPVEGQPGRFVKTFDSLVHQRHNPATEADNPRQGYLHPGKHAEQIGKLAPGDSVHVNERVSIRRRGTPELHLDVLPEKPIPAGGLTIRQAAVRQHEVLWRDMEEWRDDLAAGERDLAAARARGDTEQVGHIETLLDEHRREGDDPWEPHPEDRAEVEQALEQSRKGKLGGSKQARRAKADRDRKARVRAAKKVPASQAKAGDEILWHGDWKPITHIEGGKAFIDRGANKTAEVALNKDAQVRRLPKEAPKTEPRPVYEVYDGDKLVSTHYKTSTAAKKATDYAEKNPPQGLRQVPPMEVDPAGRVAAAATPPPLRSPEHPPASPESRTMLDQEARRYLDPGFISEGEHYGSGAFYVPMRRNRTRAKLVRGRRTGEAFRLGYAPTDPEAMLQEIVRTRGVMDSVDAFDEMIRDFSVRSPNGKYWRSTSEAENWLDTTDAGEALQRQAADTLVPVRIADVATARANLRTIQERALPQALAGVETDKFFRARSETMKGTGTGAVVLMPKHLVNLLDAHLQPTSGINKLVERASQEFKGTVLPFSPKWFMGNIIDTLGLRAIAAYGLVNPYEWRLGRRLAADLARQDPKAGRMLRSAALGGTHVSSAMDLVKRRTSEEVEGAGATLLKKTEAFFAKPGIHTFGTAFRWLQRTLFSANRVIETQPQFAALGRHARQLIKDESGSYLKSIRLSRGAYQDVLHGLKNTRNQEAFAREVQTMFGRWGALSPGEKSVLLQFMPFYSWMRNSAKFVYVTLPRDHPVKAGMLAIATAMTDQERKAMGLDWFVKEGRQPSWRQGLLPVGMAPGEGGEGGVRVGGFTSFGPYTDPNTFLSNQVLPWAAPFQDTMGGQNWKNQPLKNPDGSDLNPLEKTALTFYLEAEALIPLLRMARTGVEGGAPPTDTSTIFAPHTREGERQSLGRALRTWGDPFRQVRTGKAAAGATWGGGGTGGGGGWGGSGGSGW